MDFNNKETTIAINSADSGVGLQSQPILPIYLNNAINLTPIVQNQIQCVPISPTYGNAQGIVSTAPPGRCFPTSPVIQYNGAISSKGGTMCYSGHTLSPYKHEVFERRLIVLNSPENSVTKTPTVTLIKRQNLFPGVLENSDITQHTKSNLVSSLPPSTNVFNTSKSSSDSHKYASTNRIIPNSPIKSVSHLKIQKHVKRVDPDELVKVMSKMPSPLSAEKTNKILMKCKINLKTAKTEKIRSIFKNDPQKSKVKDKIDGQRLKVKKNIIQEKGTKVKNSKSCTLTPGGQQEKESNSKRKRIQKKGSKTSLKAEILQKAGVSSTSRWQKMSNIIQILEIPGLTKYKMCEVPIFFMNGTNERLVSDNSDDTSAYILCSSNDSILAVMVNFIRPDQYRMTFTGENYPVKPTKMSENKDTFSLKKCLFTPYVGPVTCLSEGTHIVVFGEFTDGCVADEADGNKATSSMDLAQMVSELQSEWSGDDNLVINPDIKPKCNNPLYKAMCKILKLKYKKNKNQGMHGSESTIKKPKYQLKVTLKETDKPLIKQQKTSKTNIVKKTKSKHQEFNKELIDILEKREG